MESLINIFSGNIPLMIGGSILLVLLLVTNKLLQDTSASILSKIISKIFNKKKIPTISDSMIKIFEIINSELAVIKNEMKADRAYIFEFHNGDYFVSKNSRYKMSCTYEKVSGGVSLEAKNLQSIDVTLIWDDYLKPFFIELDDNNLPSGFTYYYDYEHRCQLNSVCKRSKDILFVNVAEMDDHNGPTKSMLEKQGISYMIQVPIKSSSGVIYGIIGFDYLSKKSKFKDIPICDVCRLAKQIALLWENDEITKTNAMNYKIGDYKK